MIQQQQYEQHQQQHIAETVLVMQSGGSLGAYECGVYKTLARHNIGFDVISGSSIGSVNSTIIAASLRNLDTENSDRHESLIESAKKLEDFWLHSADNLTPAFLPFKVRSLVSAANTFIFGHPNAFIPIWFYPGGPLLHNAFTSPYLYDTTRFREILDKTINFESLRKKEDNNNKSSPVTPRLILTCTDIQKSEQVIFDSNNMDITSEHVSACIAYPFYGLKWTRINNKYLWDGALLNDTPIKAVMKSSPFREKKIIVSDTFPRRQENKLPNNFAEAWHRARDILFVDKSTNELDASNRLKEIFSLVDELHGIVSSAKIEDENLKKKVKEIEKVYNKIINKRGYIINELISIKRNEDEKSEHFLLEDWDFSSATIKELISQGEEDAERTMQVSKETRRIQ
ncbi:MAG: patatin-like phospholipase family protein [Nitrososphaeraceae archaeon]|nr:patatin-like phospholipase family protein [Nitrososphaeraceae archaeon]MBV9667642.1 patatin-like phospholipase family protein [Nitrososphaeraceae archaeon]